jgi:hypothetical protein
MFIFQLLKLIIAQLIILSKLFLNEPPFYGSANIFETQDAMEWPTKKFDNTASVLACYSLCHSKAVLSYRPGHWLCCHIPW